MSEFAGQVTAVARATWILSPTRFSWFGKPSPAVPTHVGQLMSPVFQRRYLVRSLQLKLYERFYCFGIPTPTDALPALHQADPTDFATSLSEANKGDGGFEAGWIVERFAGDQFTVRKDGFVLYVSRDDCLFSQSWPPSKGQAVRLRRPKELFNASPGSYIALGDIDIATNGQDPLIRVYWNLRTSGALRLMTTLTTRLNRRHLAFRLKVWSDQSRFVRCDSAVLYLRREDYRPNQMILEETFDELSDDLFPGVPAFSKQLARGLALAEDPGHGGSFGLQRCGILAEGVVRAHERHQTRLDARLKVIEEVFAESGVELDRPYLGPGSSDIYDFSSVHQPVATSPLRVSTGSQREDASSFGLAAEAIGRALCESAVWHGDRCSWMAEGPGREGYIALGPDLYSGTSGVGWFLAELAAFSKREEFRRTAIGAVKHALIHAAQFSEGAHMGLFVGSVGVAMAAVRASRILDEPCLVDQATQLLSNFQIDDGCEHFDIVSGWSGGILGLLALHQMLDSPESLRAAKRLGNHLIESAEQALSGWSWRDPGSPKQQNLTGFSHGTAGAAAALLELFKATGDVEYQDAAESAIDYERQWFDAAQGNWPDLRGVTRRKKHRSSLPFTTFWCHGAPGIAVSRLRAYELLGKDEYRSEADHALRTTMRSLIEDLDDGEGLCHGWSGRAEILAQGFQVLGIREYADASRLAAIRGLQSRDLTSSRLMEPSLMLGRAGLGFFYQRMVKPDLPSPLILRPADFIVE